jgi:hypothetical protein
MSPAATVETAVETKYGHVQFKRVIDDGNYGKLEASVMVPYEVDFADDAVTEVRQNIAFIQAKLGIYKQLQIDTESLEDGTIIEIVKAKFAGSTVEPTNGRSTSPGQYSENRSTQSNGGSSGRPSQGGTKIKVFSRIKDPRGGVDERGKPNVIGNPSWLVSEIESLEASGKVFGRKDGCIELWDNRGDLPQFGGDRNPKMPFFKEKNDAKAKNECLGVWPPKGSPESDAAWRHEAFQGDDYSEPF